MSESASVYGVMASWLTPSFLFVFINLVIGTIAITSRFANTTKRQQQHQLVRSPSLLDRLTSFNFGFHKHQLVDPVQNPDSPTLDRISSSSLLDRARSFNLDSYGTKTEEPNSVNKVEINPVQSSLDRVSLLDQVKSFNLSFNKTEIEELNQVQQGLDRVPSMSLLDRVRSFDIGFNKTKIERHDSVEQKLTRAPSILQRLKSLTFERSESVKEVKLESEGEVKDGGDMVEEREEEGVDAKADDFINRFRQQLRLQRLDSILRYRDMLKRN